MNESDSKAIKQTLRHAKAQIALDRFSGFYYDDFEIILNFPEQ